MFKLTLTNIKPLTVLILLVVVLIIIGLLVLIFIKYSQYPPTPLKTYNPTSPPLIGAELKQSPNFEKELEKILDILPYNGNGFRIEYRQKLKMVNVDIFATNPSGFIESRQRSENFIKYQGVQDLCALNIFWMPSQELTTNKTLDPKETITTGCSASVNPEP